jgi:PAS domain S-box-containing protein
LFFKKTSSLTNIGISLLLLPTILQLVVFMAFLWLLDQAEIDRKREAHAKEIMMHVSRVALLENKLISSILAEFGGKSPWYEPERKLFMTEIRAHLVSLHKISNRDDKTEFEFIQGFNGLAEQIYANVGQASNMEGGWMEGYVIREKIKDGSLLAEKLLASADRLISYEYSIKASFAARERGRMILFFGLSTSFVLTFLSIRFFVQRISNGLSHVSENSMRLVSGQPLLPPLPGRDEIASLDQVLHSSQQALNESARKERALTENIMDLIFSLDERGRFIVTNPATIKDWGYSTEELIGRSVVDIVSQESKNLVTVEIARARNSESIGQIFEAEVRRKDGRIGCYLWSLSYSHLDQALFCVAHDITEQKELEETKKRFLAMASHDLRSPLTSILAGLNTLRAGMYGELPDKASEKVKKIESNMKTLITFINDLLDMERLNAGEMPFEIDRHFLAPIIESSIDVVIDYADSKEIEIDADGTMAQVLVDQNRLMQVFVNVLSNAIKFSPTGSVINMTVDENSVQGFIMISVTDQGKGIPAEEIETIFDQYRQSSTAEARDGGSGLGLSICKVLMERNGGSISAQSVEGSGSCFSILIPKVS